MGAQAGRFKRPGGLGKQVNFNGNSITIVLPAGGRRREEDYEKQVGRRKSDDYPAGERGAARVAGPRWLT